MTHRYALPSLQPGGPVTRFDRDPATGEIGGPEGEIVRGWIAAAVRRGHVIGHPYPTRHALSRRPHPDLRDLALIVGQFCRLSADLQAAYPVGPADTTPDDALN
jgi:hypothetical protein